MKVFFFIFSILLEIYLCVSVDVEVCVMCDFSNEIILIQSLA